MTAIYDTPVSGSLVFCHSKGIVGKAIRLGEWLRFRRGDAYNHVAILDEPVKWGPPGDWWLIQAEARGVTGDGKLFDKAPGSYSVVSLPPGTDGHKVVEFADEQVGRWYGWATIASIVVSIITPKFLNFMLPDTWICSALAGESARFGGWYHSWPDIYQVLPSELWAAMTDEEMPHR